MALGATKERSIFTVILPAAKSGILAGVILGIGLSLIHICLFINSENTYNWLVDTAEYKDAKKRKNQLTQDQACLLYTSRCV